MPDVFDEIEASPQRDVFDEITDESGDTLRAPSRWEKIKQGFQDIAPSLLSTERSQIDDKPRGAIPALWEASGKSPLDMVPNIPEIKTGDDSIESKIENLPLNIAAGLGDFALGTARFFTSPQGVAAGGVGALGPVARRAVAAGFAPLLAKQSYGKLREAWANKDPRAATEGAALALAAGGAGVHAARGEAVGMTNDETPNDKGSSKVEIPKVEPEAAIEQSKDVFDEVAAEPVSQPEPLPIEPKVEQVVEPAPVEVKAEGLKGGQAVEYYSPITRQNHRGIVTSIEGNRVSIVNEDGAPVNQDASNVKAIEVAPSGYRFSENDVRVGKPQTQRKQRATGDDITTRVSVDAPIEITSPENWASINPDHTRYEIEARGKFEERSPAKKSESVWRVYNKATKEYIAHGLTYNDAVARAKSEMVKNNFPPEPISVGPGAASTGEIAPANLAQLTSAITRLADEVPETSPAKAFDVGRALSSAKESASGALEGLTVVSKYLVKKQEGRPEWNSFKEILGDRHLALSESVHNARKFSERALKEVPDKELQEAISNWVDTGGDEALLSAAAAESKGKYKAGYERALKLTPEQKLFAANLKNYFEARLEDAQKAGILEDGIENYIHRVYEKESAWKKGVLAELGSGVFTGKPALAKKRVFEFDFEAERAGLKPIKSFVKRVMAYDLALNKAIADRQYVKANMEVRMPDGRPAIDVAGLGSKTIPPEGEGATATLINPKWKPTDPETPAKYRGDYVAFDHPALRKWKWVSSDEAGNPTFVQGDVLVHPDAIKALRPVLEASRIRKNPVGRALLNTGSMVKQTMLDLSLFHPVQIAVHGFEHRSFKPAAEIDFTNPEVRGLIKGGMVVGETSGRAAFDEGLSGSSLTKHIPSLGPKIVELKDWIFQSYIPRLKVSTGLHALERNRARFPDLSEAELNHLTAEQMNHAFGELNYEMMGRTKTAQDALRLTALAPDFLEARAKFVTDAFTVYGREQTQALLYGAIGLYVLARILNKTISGQYRWETENAFSVIYKGKAYGLRTVQGDIIHAATDPMHFTRNRLNPAVTRPIMEAITQRDEFGRKRGLGEQAVDYVKTAIPISIKGLFQGREKTLFESLMNSTGVTVRRATANASIQKKMRDWMEANKIQTGPGEFIYDPDKDQYRKIRLAALEGDVAGARKEIEAAIKEGVPRRKIMMHFSQAVTRPMTGSRKNDAAFKQSLSGDDKLTFEEAKREQAKVFQVVRQAAQ